MQIVIPMPHFTGVSRLRSTAHLNSVHHLNGTINIAENSIRPEWSAEFPLSHSAPQLISPAIKVESNVASAFIKRDEALKWRAAYAPLSINCAY
jgi:hypothetical protein